MTGAPKQSLALLEQLNSLSKSFSNADGFGDDHALRTRFVETAEKLAIAARRPDENVFFAVTRTAQNAAIRTALALNIFNIVPEQQGESITTTEIAKQANADKVLVDRILRALAACHFLEEVGEERYAHNDVSRAFSLNTTRAMFTEIYDLISKGTYAIPDYLAKTQYKNPDSYEDSAFHLGQHSKLGFWEFLDQHEDHLKAFNSGMRSQATVREFDSSYPFDAELNKEPVKEGEVVLVDVGGGRGHALERVKQRFPNLKGRLVLQDLPAVVADAQAGGLAEGIEAQGATFFDPNPVKNARAYFFRRVLHDWPDSTCRTILSNTVSSMGPSSRVLIAEYELPAVGAPAKLVLQDLNMMAIAGMERTEKQWSELLDSVGLRLHKMWRAPPGNFVVVEGRLKTATNGANGANGH